MTDQQSDDPPLTTRSRERVESWLADFREQYGEFERVRKHWQMPPAVYERDVDRFERGINGGAGVWLAREDGAVLLVRDEGDDGWSDPGGKREDGESFEAAARRECHEETAVESRIVDLRSVHTLEIDDETDPDRPTLHSAIAIFDAEYVSGTPTPREGEIDDVAWFTEPPERVKYPEVAQRPIPLAL